VTPGFPQRLFYAENSSNIYLNLVSTTTLFENCSGIASLGPSDAVTWQPFLGGGILYKVIKSGMFNTSGFYENLVSKAYAIPSDPGPTPTFVFITDTPSLIVAAFRDNIRLGQQEITSNARSLGWEFCGAWRDGIALLVGRSQLWRYRISSNRTEMIYNNLISCTHLLAINESIVLLTAQDAHIVVDLSVAGNNVINRLPAASKFIFSGRSDILTYPGRSPTSGNIVVTATKDLDQETSSMIVLDTVICLRDYDCTSGMTCQSLVCDFAIPPQAVPHTAIPPVTPPPLSTVPAVSCLAPKPVPQAQCIGTVWVIEGDVVVSNGTVVVGSDTRINGALVVTSGATITLTGTATLNATGCASFAGSLEVERPAPEKTILGGRVVVISFDGGYCNGTKTVFASTSLRFLGQPACAKRNDSATQPEYSPTSLAIAFNYDLSDCNVGALGPGAIAGITVGAVAFVAIIVGIVLAVKFKKVIRPFSQYRSTTRVEMD
jgi:hypothetical protein